MRSLSHTNLEKTARNVCAKERISFWYDNCFFANHFTHCWDVVSVHTEKPQMNCVRFHSLDKGTRFLFIHLITSNGSHFKMQFSFDWKIYWLRQFPSASWRYQNFIAFLFPLSHTLKRVVCSNYRLGLININGLTTNWNLLRFSHDRSFFFAFAFDVLVFEWNQNTSRCHHMSEAAFILRGNWKNVLNDKIRMGDHMRHINHKASSLQGFFSPFMNIPNTKKLSRISFLSYRGNKNRNN